MAYAALPSKTAGQTLDLADYNKIKGNFEASAPDAFTTKGDLFLGTGPDAGIRLAAGADDAVLVADSGAASGLAWQLTPGARVYNDAAFDPTEDSWVAITFNQERYDAGGCHSTVSNTSRLTVPAGGAGIYAMGGNVELDTSGYGAGSEKYGIRIRLNGTTLVASDFENRNHLSFDMSFALATEYPLAVADYIELLVYVGNNVDVLALSNYSPVFWFQWLRRTP